MIPEIDKRNYEHNNRLNTFETAEFDNNLGNDTGNTTEKRINPVTGSPALLELNNDTVDTESSFISRAIDAIKNNSSALGFSEGAILSGTEFIPDPAVIKTSTNNSIVHLYQIYRGIPVFQMFRTCRFSADGKLEDITGDSVNISEEINLIPVIGVESAMNAAINYLSTNLNMTGDETDAWGQLLPKVNIDISKFIPKVLVEFPTASRYTVLEKGEFGDVIPAHLVIFHQNPKSRLAWKFIITLENSLQYEMIVGADEDSPGEILYCIASSSHMKAQGRVYESNGGENPKLISFPKSITDYPVKPIIDLPNNFPGDWVDETKTLGNNADTTICNSDISTTECRQATYLEGEVVNGIVKFEPSNSEKDDQNILNAFYFCNLMHDFFYMLGFDEKSGNFQKRNTSGFGLPGDSVKVNVFNKAVYGTANMFTPIDGKSPVLNLGIVESTNRHTALDADVVIHEYVHGVTTRLVGGIINPSAMRLPQSSGMGEGYSDYFALTIQNINRNEEKVVTGSWVTGEPIGIRMYKYDDDFPDNFGNIGKGRYSEVHNIGEIWCATLMYLNRRIVEELGKVEGYNLMWRIVVDSLKLCPANPSFLDARAAMIKVLKNLRTSNQLSEVNFKTINKLAWQTFCKFGMGPNAKSAGASLRGIVADFEMPQNI
ncbi:M36 family metallopeptidase [Bacillus sp. BR_7a]|uniref:M36 family metallopeptidase n=1 Tax=Bacillus sp. BR_7a TaxID=3055775 RepID=UPI00365FEA20